MPSGESFSFAYFLIWKDADVREAGLVDLAPEPMTPTVRRLVGRPGRARREQANVGRWPENSRDLCRDPLVAGLCARDLEIRQRLATSLGSDGLPAALAVGNQVLTGPLLDESDLHAGMTSRLGESPAGLASVLYSTRGREGRAVLGACADRSREAASMRRCCRIAAIFLAGLIYASAALVGSLKMRSTFQPAISPAFIVALRC